MKVAVVTCTGARPELFALCRRWVGQQTRKPDLWIVSNDAGEQMDVPEAQLHQFPDRFEPTNDWPGRQASMHLAFALSKVPKDYAAVVMEDDDWYAPEHIESLLAYVESEPVAVGPYEMRRYHVPLRLWSRTSEPCPVEGVVAIHPGSVAFYAKGVQEEGFAKSLHAAEPKLPCTSVGMKGVGYGLPGRRGATRKHSFKPRHGFYSDPHGLKLAEWIGENAAQDYFSLLRHP